MSRATYNSNSDSDLVWGAGAIARVIGRDKRMTFWLLERGALPARKVSGRWVASRAKLLNVEEWPHVEPGRKVAA